MKTLLAVAGLFLATQANAAFHCETTMKVGDNPAYSVLVEEPTKARDYANAILTDGNRPNIPVGFTCPPPGKLQNGGAKLSEYQCTGGLNDSLHLSIYVSASKRSFSANIYSKELNIEANDLFCTKE